MTQQIVVGNYQHGLKTNPLAFNIDNDAFPILINAYQWRGRVRRKRGTSILGRLQRFFNSASTSYGSTSSFNLVSGAGNLLTGFGLQSNGNIVPGSVQFTDSTAANTYTDSTMDGTLTGAPSGSGTINYATGAITISGGAGHTINAATFRYYPDIPVMGLENLNLAALQFPGTLAFDTTYSYNISSSSPYPIYDVSFYKNPTTGSFAGYTAKTTVTPTSWNGQDYQQFDSVNYQNAFWVTNGINVPFATTNIGMQFKPIVTTTIVAGGPPATVTLQITGHGLVVGDFVFVNEVVTTTGINLQTGYVITVTDANNVIVEFPNATIATNGTGGIAQYLTSRSDATKDCLRWYDGDPTNGSQSSPVLNGGKGWVNFCPPLIFSTANNVSIEDLPVAQYYLVGAKKIINFKDRLLFFGPVIQTSSANSQVYLQDTVIYSQNGTPFYTASFTGSATSATTVFHPILTPTNQSASPMSYIEDVTGFGGFITAGIAQPINTVSTNEDVLIIGFSNRQARFVYSGDDIVPFNFFIVNSEYGTGAPFSSITFDRGVLSIGNQGIIQTAQIGAHRIDVDIPDSVFQFNLTSNGFERISAVRDYINELVFFTYPSNQNGTSTGTLYTYPNQTLLYNYRDQTWGIFNETYTTYGLFRKQTGLTWATLPYTSWTAWADPWNSGESTLLNPEVIAGNQQGFVVIKSEGTNETPSLYIQSYSGQTITSPNHSLNEGDFIVISGAIGTTNMNGIPFEVGTTTSNTFVAVNSNFGGTYVGGGQITRMYRPNILTKQFPVSWGIGRKSRIGAQQYLLSTTSSGQIELQIYLSQNQSSPDNFGSIVPSTEPLPDNNALVYSDTLYTCPESTNLGLTPANTNLQMPTASSQAQIWHRMNTSLIGDTVQLGFTMSDTQMMDTNLVIQFSEIELHAFVLNVSPSQMLS